MPDVPVTNQGSVTIANQPIVVDWQCQLKYFLADRLPPEEMLFARWMKTDWVNPLSCGNAPDFLKLPYPELPPIGIGQLQWPTGASRYARALYAVDWPTMLQIAKDAWGYEIPIELIDPEGDPDDPENQREVPPTDVPEEWGIQSAYAVTLMINGGEEDVFDCEMFALAPYRVPGSGIDLWLLPLVCERYVWMHGVHDSTSTPAASWQSLIQSLAAEMGATITCDTVPTEYGTPNARLYSTEQPQLAAILLDAAALSVGLRVVFEPKTRQLRAINQENSERRRQARLGFTFDTDTEEYSGTSTAMLLAGGKRGIGALPDFVDVYCQDGSAIQKKSHAIVAGNLSYFRLPVWTTWDVGDSASADDFVEKLADDISAWANSGGQYAFAGPIVQPQVNGYDDFLSYDLYEAEPERYVFRTRVHELPAIFLPAVVLAGGESQSCGGDGKITFTVDSAEIADSSSPYAGKMLLQVTIITEPCNQDIETAEVVSWLACLANDEDPEALVDREGIAHWGRGRQSLASGAETGEKTPCHWILDGLCCP